MTRRRKKRREQIHRRLIFAVCAVTLAIIAITAIKTNTGQQETQERAEIVKIEENTETPESAEAITVTEDAPPDKYAVFDSMSRDWGGENEGFVFYEIPPEYAEKGGYFPEIMQIYTYCLCKQEGVSYPLIVAMIERESGYQFDTVGDNGRSFGYMQINAAANADRIEESGCTDMLNPYQNVRVGIRLMKDLIEKYGTIQDALTAYNYGEAGAYRHLWSNGIYVYDYNQSIMNRMREIEEELQNECQSDN